MAGVGLATSAGWMRRGARSAPDSSAASDVGPGTRVGSVPWRHPGARHSAVDDADRRCLPTCRCCSHELRGPLGVVRGYLRLLEQRHAELSSQRQAVTARSGRSDRWSSMLDEVSAGCAQPGTRTTARCACQRARRRAGAAAARRSRASTSSSTCRSTPTPTSACAADRDAAGASRSRRSPWPCAREHGAVAVVCDVTARRPGRAHAFGCSPSRRAARDCTAEHDARRVPARGGRACGLRAGRRASISRGAPAAASHELRERRRPAGVECGCRVAVARRPAT